MFYRFLASQTGLAYHALRIASGLLFAFHGMQKIFGLLAPAEMKEMPHFPQQMWFGGIIELVAGLMIALGLFTSWAAFIASGTMAVAYIQFHWRFQFDRNFFPALNGGEPALVYAFVFLYIACRSAAKSQKPG